MDKILVDTDILIDFLRKKQKAFDLLQGASKTADLYCSVITVAEIMAGMKPQEKNPTEDLLAGFNILPVDEIIARRAGELRRETRSRIFLPDCLIAATALQEACGLLTGNHKDYPFKGIRFFEI